MRYLSPLSLIKQWIVSWRSHAHAAEASLRDFKYWAFFRYSSQDEGIGEPFQRAIERLRVPKALRGRETALGTTGKRLIPILRDRSDLEVHADLDACILQALKESATLYPDSRGEIDVYNERARQ